jgi:hypothetical protein
MDRSEQTAAVIEALQAAITERMVAAGWAVDPAVDVGWPWLRLATYRRPTATDFAAVVKFGLRGPTISDNLPMRIGATVAVDYEPLYCLKPLILEKPTHGQLDVEIEELTDQPDYDLTVEIRGPRDLDKIGELVDAVTTHAIDYATAHSNYDELLADTNWDPELAQGVSKDVPLLLAAAHRYDQARATMAKNESSEAEGYDSPEYRRFVRRLTRWIDDGGIIPDPPTARVGRPRRGPRPRPSLAASRQENAVRKEAFETVRDQAVGKTDDELRDLLRAEYGKRGLDLAELQIELTLDAIHRQGSPLGKTVYTVQGVTAAVAHTARGINMLVKLIRGQEPPARPDPIPWLEPPEDAAYQVRLDRGSWVTVNLDAGAAEFLKRAHAALGPGLKGVPHVPSPINTNVLDAWLSEPLDDDAGAPLVIHVGQQVVGVVPDDEQHRYDSAMAAAQLRHEWPRVKARLTTFDRPPHVLLELGVPVQETTVA